MKQWIVAIGVWFCISCRNSTRPAEIWNMSPSGFKYKIIPVPGGDTLRKGDIVKLHLLQKADDSVLNDTRKKMPEYIKIDSTLRDFDYTEILPLMNASDSAVCVFPVDIIRKRAGKKARLPEFLEKKMAITVCIRVLSKFSSDSLGLIDFTFEKAMLDSAQVMEERKLFAKAAVAFKALVASITAPIRKLPSGIYVQLIRKGEGPPLKKGDRVAVIYTGMLADGTVFETTTENSPLLLHAGEGETVEGLDDGIATLGLGDKAKLYIPATLAYGANRAGNKIPAFSNLIFEVEVNKPNQK